MATLDFEHEIYTAKDITERDGVQINGDLDVEIICKCGESFYIYLPDVVYRCECGRAYYAEVKVYSDQDIENMLGDEDDSK